MDTIIYLFDFKRCRQVVLMYKNNKIMRGHDEVSTQALQCLSQTLKIVKTVLKIVSETYHFIIKCLLIYREIQSDLKRPTIKIFIDNVYFD